MTLESSYFAKQFSFPYEGFEDPIVWSDASGISRVKRYPNGYASLFKIGIIQQDTEKPSSIKKLWASISYGEDTPGGIVVASGNALGDPIDLNFGGEFFFDVDKSEFFQHNRPVKPLEIFRFIYSKHEKPTKPIRGIYLRYRLRFWRQALPLLVKCLDWTLISLLWVISGERVTGDILRRLITDFHDKPERPPQDIKVEDSKKMDFFGYKAKRWSVVFYCALHLSILMVLFFYKTVVYEFIKDEMSSSFVALCYVVVSFAITESLVPAAIKALIKCTPKIYEKIAFKAIEI